MLKMNVNDDDTSEPLEVRTDESQPADYRKRINRLHAEFKNVFRSSLWLHESCCTYKIEL